MHVARQRTGKHIRREVATFTSKDCDVYILTRTDFAHQAGQAKVEILRKRIELFRNVECDDCDFAVDS